MNVKQTAEMLNIQRKLYNNTKTIR